MIPNIVFDCQKGLAVRGAVGRCFTNSWYRLIGLHLPVVSLIVGLNNLWLSLHDTILPEKVLLPLKTFYSASYPSFTSPNYNFRASSSIKTKRYCGKPLNISLKCYWVQQINIIYLIKLVNFIFSKESCHARL